MLGGGNAGVDQPGAERPLSPRPQRSPDTVGAARELAALAAAPAGAAGFGAAAAEASADAPAGVAGAEPAPETAQPPVPAPAPAPAPAAAARLVAAKKRLPSSVLAGPNGEVPVVGATVAGPGARVDPEEPLVFLHVGAGPSALHTPRSRGRGAQSHLSCVRVGSVPSLGGGLEGKNIFFLVAANEAVAHRARAGRPLHLYCSALLHRATRQTFVAAMTAGGSELGRASPG